MGPVALAKELDVDVMEAVQLADSFFRSFPGVVKWQQVMGLVAGCGGGGVGGLERWCEGGGRGCEGGASKMLAPHLHNSSLVSSHHWRHLHAQGTVASSCRL